VQDEPAEAPGLESVALRQGCPEHRVCSSSSTSSTTELRMQAAALVTTVLCRIGIRRHSSLLARRTAHRHDVHATLDKIVVASAFGCCLENNSSGEWDPFLDIEPAMYFERGAVMTSEGSHHERLSASLQFIHP